MDRSVSGLVVGGPVVGESVGGGLKKPSIVLGLLQEPG